MLAGGVGGARFTRGLLHHLRADGVTEKEATVTVVVNTGDDLWLNGLRVCPDLDTVMYTLGGGVDEEQGWGRADESRRVASEIGRYGRGWPWFLLGDLDLATHVVRTDLLRQGRTLSDATDLLCRRWRPGARLLPMSDQPVETRVRLASGVDEHAAGETIHVEEWWVRYRARVPAAGFVQDGVASAAPAPGVLEAIHDADLVILPPSNPVVSIGTILGVPGIRDAVRATAAPVVGVSPIIGGAAVRGMAGACLRTLGVEPSATAVAEHYGARSAAGLLDAWLVDDVDAGSVPVLEAAGIRTAARPLWMRDVPSTAAIAAEVLQISASV